MGDLSSIPGQVLGELKGVVADAGKGVIQAGKDIAKGTAETLVKAATPTASQSGGQAPTEGIVGGADPMAAAAKQQRDAAARRRLSELRSELEEFQKKKKAEEAQEEEVKEQRRMEEVKMKEAKKKQEEKMVLGRLSRQYGGTGEVGKSQY